MKYLGRIQSGQNLYEVKRGGAIKDQAQKIHNYQHDVQLFGQIYFMDVDPMI